MQNVLNLSVYYTRGFFYLSLLLITSYTVHLFAKLVKRKFKEKVEMSFDSVPQVKSSFSQLKLGLNWEILMQHWARIAINKSDFVICLETGPQVPLKPHPLGRGASLS